MNIDKKDSAPQTEAEEVKEAVNTAAAEEAAAKPDEAAAEEKKSDRKSAKKEPKREEAKEQKPVPPVDELAAVTDKYLRICAEYDNFRRRSQKEKDSLCGDIKAEIVKSFLPVYDNLERALAQSTEDEAYRKGVEMIMNQFVSTLGKLDVTEIPSLGEKLDPSVHNAVMHMHDETKGEGEIVEVFQKGFRYGDKIIRFAMVKVAN